jgi:predicted 3-demethylubiquinone-9 3-methyltransferase (glyoxalase superfamily)
MPSVKHYVSIFPSSRIGDVTRYSEEGSAASGQPEGSVMTVAFELDGQAYEGVPTPPEA